MIKLLLACIAIATTVAMEGNAAEHLKIKTGSQEIELVVSQHEAAVLSYPVTDTFALEIQSIQGLAAGDSLGETCKTVEVFLTGLKFSNPANVMFQVRESSEATVYFRFPKYFKDQFMEQQILLTSDAPNMHLINPLQGLKKLVNISISSDALSHQLADVDQVAKKWTALLSQLDPSRTQSVNLSELDFLCDVARGKITFTYTVTGDVNIYPYNSEQTQGLVALTSTLVNQQADFTFSNAKQNYFQLGLLVGELLSSGEIPFHAEELPVFLPVLASAQGVPHIFDINNALKPQKYRNDLTLIVTAK